MARSVGESSVEPLEQAEPTEQATPGQIERHQQDLAVDAGKGHVAGLRQPLGRRRRARPPRAARPAMPASKRSRSAVNRRACSSCSRCQSSSAVAMPTANATDSLPGRSPACWCPPNMQRRQRHVPRHEQRPDAQRASKLVGGNAHGRHAQAAEAHRQLARHLHGVGMQRHPGLVADRRQLGDRLEHARLVVAQRARSPGAARPGRSRCRAVQQRRQLLRRGQRPSGSSPKVSSRQPAPTGVRPAR